MKVESREYKLLINHEPFVAADAAVEAVWGEIEAAVKTLPLVRTKGELTEEESRGVLFLDTPDHTLRRNGLILRRRSGKEVEFTLKCRSEDRYFAAGTDVSAAAGLHDKQKLEEDIAPPFVCRFSHSATVAGVAGRKPRLKTPETLREAAAMFPLLGTLRADGRPCHPDTALAVVNEIEVDERVWKGGKIAFEKVGDEDATKATVAVILWTRVKADQPAAAELSFRVEDNDEHYGRHLAQAARAVYSLLQRLDCARVGGMTKTEFIYRDASRD
jgi:hypothetical protein